MVRGVEALAIASLSLTWTR